MTGAAVFAVVIILVALAFDVSNGWHDAANSIATIVSTRVLSPRVAVFWAAAFNVAAVLFLGTHVAKTIGKDVIGIETLPTFTALFVLLAALMGAITWNVVTWYFGLPSSSSHALVGGLCGGAIAEGGLTLLRWVGIEKTVVFMVVAPIVGMFLGAVLMMVVAWIFRRVPPLKIDRGFRVGQLFSAALVSIGHGTNDSQKTMGVIFMVLSAVGGISAEAKAAGHIPLWVELSCYAAMGFGTAFGGWRIVKTMGMRITNLKPVGGFAAEVAGGITLLLNSYFGIPVSTTHVVTGAITGVGFTRGARAVKWGVAGRIVWAWILTIPAAGLIAFLAMSVFRLLGA